MNARARLTSAFARWREFPASSTWCGSRVNTSVIAASSALDGWNSATQTKAPAGSSRARSWAATRAAVAVRTPGLSKIASERPSIAIGCPAR
jgi:hypothetical protein